MASTAQKPLWRRTLLVMLLLLLITALKYCFWPSTQQSPMGNFSGSHRTGGRSIISESPTLVHGGVVSRADVPIYLYALGTVIPNATVTVTSRVDGQLINVLFVEGQKVEAGQLLAQIDARSYQATLAQYQGMLAQNQAQLKSAELTLARYQKLFTQNVLSRQDLDTQIATVGQYRGAIQAAQAQIDTAKLNIDYANITAPVSGRVGLRLMDVGNMVRSNDTTGIVTITQTQPTAVTFSVPQCHIPEVGRALHHGQSLPVTLFDQNNITVLEQGALQYMSNNIDIDTGSIKLKATFANHQELLYPNQFVNVRLQTGTLKQVTVIPAQALQLSSDGSFVYVIDDDNTVRRTTVKIGPAWGEDQQAILSGVNAGEKVVTEGIDRLIQGSKVQLVSNQQTNDTTKSDQGQ